MGELKDIFRRAVEIEKIRIRQELALLRSLKGPEKRRHIIEYYRFHMLVMGLILFFLGSGIHNIINPPKEPILTIAWLAGFEEQENLNALAKSLTYALAENPDREITQVIPFIFIGRPEFDVAQHGRLAAMITAADIDIVISTVYVDEDGETMADLTPFWAFQSVLPFLEEVGLPDDSVLYFVEDGWDPLPHGVFLHDSTLFKLLDMPTKGKFLSVMSNTPRGEAVLEAMRVIWFGN